MKKILALILALLLMVQCAFAGAEALPPRSYDIKGHVFKSYDSETLKYTVKSFRVDQVLCYLSIIWVQDPAKQIRKATAQWQVDILDPEDNAKQIPEAALVINGSGYVSPVYPWIPENYPGTNEDYYYTPLGSLTVTDGEVFRNLEGVPYYGLTLDGDGLQMYVGEDNEAVLATDPTQTWSFYVECPMIRNNEILTPEDWTFAGRKAQRTVIGRVDRNNYLILTVTNDKDGKTGGGLSLHRINEFFLKHFEMEWVYDLDGGPSSALLTRKKGSTKLKPIVRAGQKSADIMAFIELPTE